MYQFFQRITKVQYGFCPFNCTSTSQGNECLLTNLIHLYELMVNEVHHNTFYFLGKSIIGL